MLETRKVYTYENEQYVFDLKSFGWEITESSVEHADGLIIPYCGLARNKEMDNYEELHDLEVEYENQRKSLVEYEEIDLGIFLILLLILILPGVIYYIYKSNQKKGIEQYNEQYLEKMKQLVEEAKKIYNK